MPLPIAALSLGIQGLQMINSGFGAARQADLLEQSDEAKSEARASQREGQLLNHRSALRQQKRRQRIVEARIRQGAAASGVTGSSGEAGAIASLKTNTATNLSLLESSKQRADDQSGLFQQAADLRAEAGQDAQDVAKQNAALGLAGSLFNTFGTETGGPAPVIPDVDSIFTPQ